MIGTIARKELLEYWRDARLVTAMMILILLFGFGLLSGWLAYLDLSRQAQKAGLDERERWLTQSDKHPHAAAHYGVFAFKSPRLLSILDSGIQPFVGSAVWLEAHKQNEMLYRPAEDATSLQRFGDLTVATVGQALLPLLIIFMGYTAFAGEREQGTLKQLSAIGIEPWQLLAGKALAQGGVLMIVLLPVFGLSLVIVVLFAPPDVRIDELERLTLFAACYLIYLGGYLFLTLAVSAGCRSSRLALVLLLAFWALSVLLAPRMLSDWARDKYPSTSAITRKHTLEETLEREVAAKIDKKIKQLLADYQVSKIEDLPVDPTGVILQTDEEASYAPFEDFYQNFFDRLRAQNRFYQIGALISPMAGLQLVSMALTGNDLEQHRDFIEQAEKTRRLMHTLLNEYVPRHSVKNTRGEWELEAGSELWKQIPSFHYVPRPWTTILPHYRIGLGVLLAWLGWTVVAAILALPRMQRI